MFNRKLFSFVFLSFLFLNIKCTDNLYYEEKEPKTTIIFDYTDQILKIEKKNSWCYIDSNKLYNYNNNLVRPNYIINDSIILFNTINGNILTIDISTGNVISEYNFNEDYRWKIGNQCQYEKIKNFIVYSSKLELLIFNPDYSIKFDIKRKFNIEYINELGLYPDSLIYSIDIDSTVIYSKLFCQKIHSDIKETYIILDTCFLQ